MPEETTYAQIAKASEDVQEAYFAKPNVVGVAVGHKITDEVDTGKPCLTVFVSQKVGKEELRAQESIPTKEAGVVTDVVETGEFFADECAPGTPATPPITPTPPPGAPGPIPGPPHLPIHPSFEPGLQERWRPACGGCSIGHYQCGCAGTLGTCVYDVMRTPGIPSHYYLLSNNHVIARVNEAQTWDQILQPGPLDGGDPATDTIAYLARFVPIRFISGDERPVNYVDAAIAEGSLHDLNREIYWIGYVRKVNAKPRVDDIVEKSGRTTGFTLGKVTNLDAAVTVNYSGGRRAFFKKQIVTTNMSAPGDSGSLICDTEEGAVGLLFAGSSARTIANPIPLVLRALRIQLHP